MRQQLRATWRHQNDTKLAQRDLGSGSNMCVCVCVCVCGGEGWKGRGDGKLR